MSNTVVWLLKSVLIGRVEVWNADGGLVLNGIVNETKIVVLAGCRLLCVDGRGWYKVFEGCFA